MSTSPATPAAAGAQAATATPAAPTAAKAHPAPVVPPKPSAVPAEPTREPTAPAAKPIDPAAFSRALASQRAAKARIDETKQQTAALAKEKETLAAREKELAPLLEMKGLLEKGDALAVAERLAGGEDKLDKFLEQLTSKVVAGRKGAATRQPGELPADVKARLEKLDALEQSLEALKTERAEEKKSLDEQRAEYEASQRAAAGERFLADGWAEVAKKADDFELSLVYQEEAQQRVSDKLVALGQSRAKEAKSQRTAYQPLTQADYLAAAAEVEAELLERQEKGLTTKKVRAKLASAGSTKAAPPAASTQGKTPKTVTTQRGATPAGSPDWNKLTPKQRLLAFKRGEYVPQ